MSKSKSKTKYILNYPFKDYTEHEGINNSSFQSIDPDRDGCPAIWHANQINKPTETSSPALFFGKVFHKYILEMDDFFNDYTVLDAKKKQEIYYKALDSGSKAKGFSKSLGSYKDEVARLKRIGMEFIEPELVDTLGEMRTSVSKQIEPYDDVILGTDRITELSVFAELYDFQGRPALCKGRIDAYKKNKKIVDLKTTVSASPNHLARHIPKMKLYVQAAFYMDLMKANGENVEEFWWCFVDKRAPYPVSYIQCEEGMLNLGRHEYRTWLGWINDGRETDNWSGHLNLIDWPDYFIKQIDML